MPYMHRYLSLLDPRATSAPLLVHYPKKRKFELGRRTLAQSSVPSASIPVWGGQLGLPIAYPAFLLPLPMGNFQSNLQLRIYISRTLQPAQRQPTTHSFSPPSSR